MQHAQTSAHPHGADVANEAQHHPGDRIDPREKGPRDQGEIVAVVVQEGYLGHREQISAVHHKNTINSQVVVLALDWA